MVIDFDLKEPLDVFTAVRGNMNNNTKLYFKIISSFEVVRLNKGLDAITSTMAAQDWKKVKETVTELKSASGYIGAVYVHYACYYIEEAYNAKDFLGMLNFYPLIVEAVI